MLRARYEGGAIPSQALAAGPWGAETRRVNRLNRKTRKISWRLATLLVVVFGINVIGMIHALLTLLFPERFSNGGVVAPATVVLAIAGVAGLAARRRRPSR
jgi:uncharacterized membrane protein